MEIRRLIDDEYLDKLVLMHQKISMDNNLKGLMIYYDANFPQFLNKSLTYHTEYYYGLFVDNELIGFSHFKTFEKTLFLNNLYIGESYRGEGAGRQLIAMVMSQFEGAVDYFGLDVIRSNTKAYNWYLRIGLNVTSVKSWVKLHDEQIAVVKVSDLLINKKDDNNFDSLFFADRKVATIINNSKLILHDFAAVKEVRTLGFEIYCCLTICELEALDFKTLEFTERMVGDFGKVYNSLNKCLRF